MNPVAHPPIRENTIASFTRAKLDGADGCESDVQVGAALEIGGGDDDDDDDNDDDSNPRESISLITVTTDLRTDLLLLCGMIYRLTDSLAGNERWRASNLA